MPSIQIRTLDMGGKLLLRFLFHTFTFLCRGLTFTGCLNFSWKIAAKGQVLVVAIWFLP